MNYKQALGYNLLSAATCYVGFVFGVAIGDLDPTYASFIFALAAGMFLYISLCSMLSDMNEKSEEAMKKSTRAGLMTLGLQCAGLFTGLALMYYFGVYF
uniref:DUF4199 domain-containing protein n=1 Tax=Steinernema glaseri TaxID=37863 RepID=A0A1I7Z374_9BILA